MRKRLTRIAAFQLGKVFAVLYAIFSIPIAVIMGIAASFGPPGQSMPIGMIVAIPVFYVVFGFLFMALAAWLYNVVAKWTGGVEYVTEELTDA
jgi:hypothetical protein